MITSDQHHTEINGPGAPYCLRSDGDVWSYAADCRDLRSLVNVTQSLANRVLLPTTTQEHIDDHPDQSYAWLGSRDRHHGTTVRIMGKAYTCFTRCASMVAELAKVLWMLMDTMTAR